MDIFQKMALRGLRLNRARTLATAVGVALSAALITAALSFGVSLLCYLAEGAAARYGSWQLKLESVSPELARGIARDARVESVTATEDMGCARLEGLADTDRPYLFLSGYSEAAFEELPLFLVSGRLPENGGELVVSGRVSSRGGAALGVGDELTLELGRREGARGVLGRDAPYDAGGESLTTERRRSYTVVGICRTPDFEAESQPGYFAATLADGAESAGRLDLFVTLRDARQVYDFAESAAGDSSRVFNNSVLRFMGLSREPGDRLFNTLLYTCGAIVVGIVTVGAVFLIYNSFSISLGERSRQLGVLMSVGATRRQLRGSVLFEGLCIGALGIPPGILLGLAGVRGVIALVGERFADILYSGVPLSLRFSLPALLAAAAVSLATILISAYIPARRAAAAPVMDCVRQTGEINDEARGAAGSGPMPGPLGLEAALAQRSFRRSRRRCRSVVLSLILSVVLFISASSFTAGSRQLGEGAAVATSMDLCFSTRDMDDGELERLYGRLRTAHGVTDGSRQALMSCSCEAAEGSFSADFLEKQGSGQSPLRLTLMFLDDVSYAELLGELGLGGDAGIIAVAKLLGDGAEPDELENIFSGDTVSVEAAADNGETRTLRLRLAGFVPPDSPPAGGEALPDGYYFEAIAPYSLKAELGAFGDAAEVKGLCFLSDDPDGSAAEMEAMIQAAGVTAPYELLNLHRALDDSRNYVFIVDVFAYTFIAMISLIAVANVFNSVSTGIRLRRRELAMLRSVGMGQRDFMRMMNWECVLLGAKALALGLPLATGVSWLIHRAMFIADSVSFSVPWQSVGLSVLGVLAVIFIAMLYSVGRLRRENIIDALRDDMT